METTAEHREHPLTTTWRLGWLLLGLIGLSIGFIFYDGLKFLVHSWNAEEYSHGYLIPVISAFLIWQKKDELPRLPVSSAWLGFFICLIGLAVFFLGKLSTLYIIIHYSLLIVLTGLVVALLGWQGLRLLWAPLFILVFMIPLPAFLYNNLSQSLQLLSSKIGVEVVRLFGISVFLEGNVIDLGSYKLQVVEACNGLRYLFPLMSFGFICAYIFSAPLWQRAVVFLSTIPLTVLMNSFRIGVIGVLVDRWGTEQAEGFLHDFEGWVIFMACVAILFLEMWLLTRWRNDKRSFREVFGLELPAPGSAGAPVRDWAIQKPFVACGVLLLAAAAGTLSLSQRAEAIPNRAEFTEFPDSLGEWQGKRDRLEQIYLDTLKLTDYVISDYRNPAGDWVNIYVAYYESQRAGESVHSPRSCIPGGGWEIKGHSLVPVEGASVSGAPLVVNRVEIQKGENKQLVYYWFQQRGRVITNEYLVKWFLFWDSLTRNRSDGSLVRLTTFIREGEDWAKADARLATFAGIAVPQLGHYVPD